MKTLFNQSLFFIFLLSCNFAMTQENIIFNENFESASRPSGWTEEKVNGTFQEPWKFGQIGGHDGNPAAPYQGNYNAMFQKESYDEEATILITPSLNLENIIKPELRFFHVQDLWEFDGLFNDRLRVLYKRGIDSAWVQLAFYESIVENWVERKIIVPDSVLTDDFYFGFEGTTGYGHGTCIDSMTVVETGVLKRFVDTIKVKQINEEYFSSSSTDNPLLRIDVIVKGNDQQLILQQLNITSKNFNDAFIANNGIKLYYTGDTVFKKDEKIGTEYNFSGGVAAINNLNKVLMTGNNTIWVTFDIGDDINHEMHETVIDAKITSNSIIISDSTYANAFDPDGEAMILEAVFADDFETDKSWIFTGEFERGIVAGLGGSDGVSDPDTAYSGANVIGTDVTGLDTLPGDYGANVSLYAMQAVSPSTNLKFYQDVSLFFRRQLNVDLGDYVWLEYSTDGGANWSTYWKNNGSIVSESDWKQIEYDISEEADRNQDFKIRFALGPTNGLGNFSGWNIDDIYITGDYLNYDVAVVDWIYPYSSCGHLENDSVLVKVANLAGEPSPAVIPIEYSVDGGTTIYRDTIFQSIAVDDTIEFKFPTKVDLSVPGLYDMVFARTRLEEDEATYNDQYDTEFFIYPDLSLPYAENFETNDGFWYSDNEVFEYGEPNGVTINSAASGSYAWGTKLDFYYSENDSVSLISPCFDFTGTDHPIFEAKLWYATEKDQDGLALDVSTDDGQSWHRITNNDGYNGYWNWYADSSVVALNSDGWSGVSGGWITVKHLLPDTLAGKSQVKFRFIFEADENGFNEGVAIDDIKIYDNPLDIQLESIDSPLTDQCDLSTDELVELTLRNVGIEQINTGEEIIIAIDVDGEQQIIDTTVASSDVAINATFSHTLSKGVNLNQTGSYTITAYTLSSPGWDFYNQLATPDTAEIIANVNKPFVDIGELIQTVETDTLRLAAFEASITSYEWSFSDDFSVIEYSGADADTLTGDYITNYLNTSTTDTTGVYLRFSNGGCPNMIDSVTVVRLIRDIGVVDQTSLANNCELLPVETLRVKIKNFGTDTVNVGDSIQVGYIFENQPVFKDTILANTIILPGDTLTYEFDNSFDLSAMDSIYDFQVFASTLYLERDFTNNDTIIKIESYGYPNYDMQPDEQAIEGISLVLDASVKDEAKWNGVIASYLWGDGHTEKDTTVTESGWFYVTITDSLACSADDSIYVHLQFKDVELTQVFGLDSACIGETEYYPEIQLVNTGDTLRADDYIDIKYRINSESYQTSKIILGSDLNPDETRNFTLDQAIDYSAANNYVFEFVNYTDDENKINAFDTLTQTIEIYGYPNLDIGPDSLYTREDSILLDAGSGFDEYFWSNNSTSESIKVGQNGDYKIEVTNYYALDDRISCSSRDSINLLFLYSDIATQAVSLPESACQDAGPFAVSAAFANNGNDTIFAGTSIPVKYIIGEEIVSENMVLAEDFLPDSVLEYTFVEEIEQSEAGEINFNFVVKYSDDELATNDTSEYSFTLYALPTIDLGSDLEIDSDNYTIEAGEYSSYLWNTESTESSINVSEDGEYWVRVTNENGCVNSDTISIAFALLNMNILSMDNPESGCGEILNQRVNFTLENTGSRTLKTGDEITASFTIDEEETIEQVFTLDADLLSDANRIFEFDELISITEVGEHTIALEVEFEDQLFTKSFDIEVFEGLDFEFDEDTIHVNLPYVVSLSQVFNSYTWHDGSHGITYTARQYGWISLIVDNSNNCADKDSMYIAPISFVEQINSFTSEMNVYPNPFEASMYIDFYNAEKESLTIKVYDGLNRLIKAENPGKVDLENYELNLSQLASGIYYLHISSANKRAVIRIMKK